MGKKINEKQIKVSLLCLATLVVGLGVGLSINRPKTIPLLTNGDEVLATLDGKEFTANDLYAKLKTQGGNSVLTNIIDDYIASIEITDTTEAETYAESYLESIKAQYEQYGYDFEADLKAAGYNQESEFVEFVKQDRLRTLTAEKYIKENMITDKEINSYWKENIVGSMHVRYILIAPENSDDMTDEQVQEEEAKALNEAKEVIEKLKNGEKFEDLAKTHSDDSSTASQGGLFDGFVKDDVVSEFWDACVALKDGEYTTTPVKSSYGYFVISRISQDEKPTVEDSKDEILDALLYQKENESEVDSNNSPIILKKAWVKIRKNYNLSIIDSDLEKDYKNSIKDYE